MAAGAIFLGVLAGLVVLCTFLGALCPCQDGAKGGGGGGGEGVSSAATGKQEALLNKEDDDRDVDLCAICKARLADAGWGPCRRLRPCGHEYHADCIGLWLQRKRICPVCRADVAVSWTEILDALV